MEACRLRLSEGEVLFDSVIYAVGHCPSGGFGEASRVPLSEISLETYEREISMHQRGPLLVFQKFLGLVRPGGSFVFLSSAVTRDNGVGIPPSLHIQYHASVIAGLDWLVAGMRRDPAVLKRGILVHRIAPGAVDTPFHRGHDGPKPPKVIPAMTVATKVVLTIGSSTVVDEMVL
jgi:NAD(P)-dependent dehydrogenase (short-subunit alcohol dehydrogenase family)